MHCSTLRLRPRPAVHLRSPQVKCRCLPPNWRRVQDPGSGKEYYWNTEDNTTSWEPPVVVAAAAATPAPAAPASPQDRGNMFQSGGTASAAKSKEELLQLMCDAYVNDTQGGMGFWEAARAERGSGVFEDAFVDVYLQVQIKSCREAGRAEQAELITKVQARLCNPLLRQPAPWE